MGGSGKHVNNILTIESKESEGGELRRVNRANLLGKPINRGRNPLLNLSDGGFTMAEFTFNGVFYKRAGRIKPALFSLGL